MVQVWELDIESYESVNAFGQCVDRERVVFSFVADGDLRHGQGMLDDWLPAEAGYKEPGIGGKVYISRGMQSVMNSFMNDKNGSWRTTNYTMTHDRRFAMMTVRE